MITPNKTTQLKQSIIYKMLSVLDVEFSEISIMELYTVTKKNFNGIEEFMLALDVLYVLDKIDVDLELGESNTMLIELRCKKLIENRLEFKNGLNSILGPDNGANSIGKSSVLMLIDFAFGGEDFPNLCKDVIEHVGEIEIEMDFCFDEKKYSFYRSTNDSNIVRYLHVEDDAEKSLSEFKGFLQSKYKFPQHSASFRSTVSPFFRVWGKENDNPNKPLHSFAAEPYKLIKNNLLKLFSHYEVLKEVEKEKKITEESKKVLLGAFKQGYVPAISNARELRLCQNELIEKQEKINVIKNSIEQFTINANQIISDENLQTKIMKDSLSKQWSNTKNRLYRVDENIKYGNSVSKRQFEKLRQFFPEVNEDRLLEVEKFHTGVSKILKNELRKEREILQDTLNSLTLEIAEIDDKLTKSLKMLDKPSELVDKLLELSLEEKQLQQKLKFKDLSTDISQKVEAISSKLHDAVAESLKSIEGKLNSAMANYIARFYDDELVSPEIKLLDSRYEFNHKSDSGTGKAYANLISLDLSFLELSYVPALMHDLIIFSNIEDHAMERIIETYSTFPKQIFIAIDKIGRYDATTQKILNSSEFLSLSETRLAFIDSWKRKGK